MSYLIDSDWIADYLGGHHEAGEVLASLWRGGISISIISYMEIIEGVRRGRSPTQDFLTFRRFLKQVDVHIVKRPVAEKAADIRISLRQEKRQVNHRALDILIAATAIVHHLILVTHNLRHYADIPDLQLHQLSQ